MAGRARGAPNQRGAVWVSLFVIIVLLFSTGAEVDCNGPQNITVPQSDDTNPGVGLEIGDISNHTDGAVGKILVTDRSPAAELKLTDFNWTLEFFGHGRDEQSGVHALEVWIFPTYWWSGEGDLGKVTNPNMGKPWFSSSDAPAGPGGVIHSFSRVGYWELNLSDMTNGLGGGWTLERVKFVIRARAVNHLGGKEETSLATVTWTRN